MQNDTLRRLGLDTGRVTTLSGSLIRGLFDEGTALGDVLPLWFGEGDRPAAPEVTRSAIEALKQGDQFYQPNLGLASLRAALADYMQATFDIPMDLERIAVTSSGMQALSLAMQTIIQPGQRVVAVDPLWPNIAEAAKLAGGQLERISLQMSSAKRFELDMDRLLAALTHDTRVLIINSPSNPTGWVATDADIRTLAEHCEKHGIWIIADEVYHRLVYDERKAAPSILSVTNDRSRLLVVNSFSKTWCMTGWRLGWLTMPAGLSSFMTNLIEFNTSSAPPFVQRAAETALGLGAGPVDELRAHYARNRTIIHEALSSHARLRLPDPTGAFYAFPQIDGVTDSLSLARDILHKTCVGTVPGRAFGASGEGHIRLCYARKTADIHAALDRLTDYFNRMS